jgi:hypothetical protein
MATFFKVAIFVLTSILKELQWQIRTETDQTVDQSEVLAVVRAVLAVQNLTESHPVDLKGVPVALVATIATQNQLVQHGRSVFRTTLTRLTPSQKHRRSLTT